MLHDESSSPSQEKLNTTLGVAGTALLFASVIAIFGMPGPFSPKSAPVVTIADAREAVLVEHQEKAAREAKVTQWANTEDKIARIPVAAAIDLVVKKFETIGNVSFAGDAVPTVGSKLTTGPFTLVEIPPLAQDNARDAELLELAKDPEAVEEGYYQYEAYCLACHGGPNMPGEGPTVLFDGEWYYSPTPSQMEQLIWKGIIEKGMPPWEGVLPPEVTGQLLAYMLANQSK